MERPNTRVSAKKRKTNEAHETLAEAKKTRLNNGITRSSADTVHDYDEGQKEGITTATTTAHKIIKRPSKSGSKISKATTKSAQNDAKIAQVNVRKQPPNQAKPLKRKGTRDEPDGGLEFPIADKKPKVAGSLKRKTAGESVEKVGKVAEAHETSKVMATVGKGDIVGIGSVKSTSGNNLPEATSEASPAGGSPGCRTSGGQTPEVKIPSNSFIITDPNKPRPRGLGRAHFKETPAYKKLMEVATQVKRVARIMTNKLIAAKAASKEYPTTDSLQKVVADACEKLVKFNRTYSSQVKFLSVEEFMALLKAAVQCLGDIENAELPDHNFQKALCTFLDKMELSESQATTVGLYPVLEIYKVEEEYGEVTPDVKELVASINASLLKKSKVAEKKLVNPDYVPEDYLTKMQKRVLAMGNVPKPVYDDWDKFLKDSTPPKSIVRAERPTFKDQLISKDRTNKRLETKMRNINKVTRQHTYQAKQGDEPMESTSSSGLLRFDEME